MAYWVSSNSQNDGESMDDFLNSDLDYLNFDGDSYGGWGDSPQMNDQMFTDFPYSSPPFSDLSSFVGQTSGPTFSSSMDYNVMIGSYDNMFHRDDDSLCRKGVCKNVTEDENYNNITIPRSPSRSLSEKMLKALSLFKVSSGDGILAQLWVPFKQGDHHILSTHEQPFLLDQPLAGYREVSRLFTFSAEVKPGSSSGLPGRVFSSKVPEWTSNIIYYNKDEYLRVDHAVNHHVRGSIGIPIFANDPNENSCCAVLELVTMLEKPHFDLEMENVARALQAVDLKSSPRSRFHPKLQCISKNQRAALTEITDVLRVICHVHKLPLALTWIPCSYSLPGLIQKCVLRVEDSACYVNDQDLHGFILACEEHYLEEGQGVAGKALQSNHPFFYSDVKSYDIYEYPLVHHARKFHLNSAVAIRLRSTFTGDDDYIIEFFLPVDMNGSMEQQLLLNSLAGTMQRICKSLRTVSEESLCSVTDMTMTESSPDSLEQVNEEGLMKKMEKKRTNVEKNVSLSDLQKYFSGSLKDAAKSLGVCPTTLKRICRQQGISRWPSRKINKVNRSLKKIQTVLDSVQGVDCSFKYDPSTGSIVAAGTTIPTQELDDFRPGNHEELSLATDDPIELTQTDSSNGSASTPQANPSTTPSSIERQKLTVKATYEEDTIRFKFDPFSGCDKLYEEVAIRFKLQLGTFHLKYLDDEEEWVMLVNDSDLQECLDILDFVGTRSVKFVVRETSSIVGSSGSSNCFLMGGS